LIKISGFSSSESNREKLNLITGRLKEKDPTIWGVNPAAEAANRLDWIDLPRTSRDLLPQLDALSAWSRELGHQRFILCGMGGSSLAPEVIALNFGKNLIVLDSTDPEQIAEVVARKLNDACIIISSKSGTTIETKSHFAFFMNEIRSQGLEPSNHFVIVTDSGSDLELTANASNLKLILANPKVGGRFSALSAFGLTPAALLGVDISILLDDAQDACLSFADPDSDPVKVAAALYESNFPEIFDKDSLPGLGDWIEQLIGESTGKDGRGILPIVVQERNSEVITFNPRDQISIVAPLGAQFIFWEWVTALLCYLLEVDPFNQPNVTESKDRTSAILAQNPTASTPILYEDSLMVVYGEGQPTTLTDLLKSFFIDEFQYISIMVYLNRNGSDLSKLQTILRKSENKVSFGWGPRFLHSIGQFHKGGPRTGAFIQITGESIVDFKIPNAAYSFSELIAAQAAGDFEALTSRKLPAIRIHLKDRESGSKKLIEVCKTLI
jgi:glucose-6-phosphate isomerase